MEEGKLEIVQKGEYNNAVLKTKYRRNGLKLILDDKGNKQVIQQGLKPGQYVVLTKKYVEGKEFESKFGVNYSCVATYDGKEISFWLKPHEHEAYAKVGGEGDKVKVIMSAEKYTHPTLGVELEKEVLNFEKVE